MNMDFIFVPLLLYSCVLWLVDSVHGGAIKLDEKSIDGILASNELVFINFYADWCRFSSMLAPVWDQTADKVKSDFPQDGRVVIGKVDCDSETNIAQRFHITKYPTLKLVRHGQLVKREYRGQRSLDAFANFVKEQLRDPIEVLKSSGDLDGKDEKKRKVIGYFENEQHPEYASFQKVASKLKDDCLFLVLFGDGGKIRPPGSNLVVFRDSNAPTSGSEDIAYTGEMNEDSIHAWAVDQCVPLVREITFENAEELTEEGLPFLILFHEPQDTEIVKKYRKVVEEHLLTEKQNVNFLVADGNKFAHPLHHLGKSKSDLPLIAIDSFRHMYLYPDVKNMETPGSLKTFLQDLYSGKLHREFHYGPDPTTTTTTTTEESSSTSEDTTDEPKHVERRETKTQDKPRVPTTPPESTFKNLRPSKNRYTLLRDEL